MQVVYVVHVVVYTFDAMAMFLVLGDVSISMPLSGLLGIDITVQRVSILNQGRGQLHFVAGIPVSLPFFLVILPSSFQLDSAIAVASQKQYSH